MSCDQCARCGRDISEVNPVTNMGPYTSWPAFGEYQDRAVCQGCLDTLLRERQAARAACDHDWRVNPHTRYLDAAGSFQTVCTKCGSKGIKRPEGPRYTDDPNTWPKA